MKHFINHLKEEILDALKYLLSFIYFLIHPNALAALM